MRPTIEQYFAMTEDQAAAYCDSLVPAGRDDFENFVPKFLLICDDELAYQRWWFDNAEISECLECRIARPRNGKLYAILQLRV